MSPPLRWVKDATAAATTHRWPIAYSTSTTLHAATTGPVAGADATPGIIPSVGTIAAGAVIDVHTSRAGCIAIVDVGANAGDGAVAAAATRDGAVGAGIYQRIDRGAARIDIIGNINVELARPATA